MKKIISLVLVLVLVFSLAVPSFAYDSEIEALESIDHWVESIWQIVTLEIANDVDSIESTMDTLSSRTYNILEYLLDIDDFTRSNFYELQSFNDNFFGDSSWVTPFAEIARDNLIDINSSLSWISDRVNSMGTSLRDIHTALYTLYGLSSAGWAEYEDSWYLAIYNDIHQLKEVLSDDEDLAFKESQKENQQYIQDTFFKPGSDLSLNVSELTDFTSQFTDFTDSFDFIDKVGTSTSPLESISEGSDFSQWFTNETGQDMDPTFGGGSGGGGGETPDPDDPDPDDPDPDDPNPPTPTIKNWLPLATSEPGGSEIYNGIGYLPGHRWSNSAGAPVAESGFSITGFIPCSVSDTIFVYNLNINATVPVGVLFNNSSRVYSIGGNTLSPDSNGVFSFSPSDYVSTCNYFRIVFLGESASNGIISINQYPIQTASTFSLRAQPVPYEPEIVTSAYSDRMNEFYKLLGGDD